jgi:hypothetical protein
MIQHIWTIPCRIATTDRESNNVSLIEVLEEFTIPAVVPQQPERGLVPAIFDVVTLWARADDDQPVAGTGRMSFLSPDGEALFAYEYEIDLRESRRIRSVGRVLGFPAPSPGRYHFRIECRVGDGGPWEQLALVPLWVNILRSENPPEPQRDVGAP